jgi:hypothetical protein
MRARRVAKTDLFFLKASVENGMSFSEVAGFLGRDEDEVQKKAKELQIRPPRRK